MKNLQLNRPTCLQQQALRTYLVGMKKITAFREAAIAWFLERFGIDFSNGTWTIQVLDQ